MITGLTDDELLILINTLHASLPAEERKVLMLKLSDARSTQIVERNRARFNMRQTLARDDR